MSPVLVEVVLSSAEVQRCVVCWSLKFWVDVGCNRLLISFNFAASRLVYVCQQIQLQHDPISLCITQSLIPVLFPKYRTTQIELTARQFQHPFG